MLCKCSGKYIDIYFILKITYYYCYYSNDNNDDDDDDNDDDDESSSVFLSLGRQSERKTLYGRKNAKIQYENHNKIQYSAHI